MKFMILKALSGNLTVETLFLLLKLLALENSFAKRISTIGRGGREKHHHPDMGNSLFSKLKSSRLSNSADPDERGLRCILRKTR